MSEKYITGFCETLDWRPLGFVDLLPTESCSLCSVVPGKTYVLQCSHPVCELCYGGLLKSGRRCPLDEECFDERRVEKRYFTRRQVEAQMLFCTNSKEGCTFIGAMEQMKRHFLRECNFHAVMCRLCNAKVLRREIVNHYTQGRCQHGISFPDGDYSHADLMASQMKPYGSVRKHGEKMEQLLNEHQELLKRILEKQERLETTVSKAGNEFYEKVEEQTRFIGEAVNKSFEISLANVSTNLSTVLQKQDCTAADLSDVARQLHSHHEEQTKVYHEVEISLANVSTNLSTVLEKQECAAADLSGVAQQLHSHHEEQTKVYHEVMKADIALERLSQDTNKNFSAMIEKISGLSEEIGSSKESVVSNSRDVSKGRVARCLQSATDSIADVSCKLTRLENLQIITRDLDVLLQRSEEGMKFINVDAEAKEKKPIAKAIFDISQKMKSVEEAMSSLYELNYGVAAHVAHIKGFSNFRKEGNEEYTWRFSDVFSFCGYSVKLKVAMKQINDIVYLGLYLCVCQSPKDSLLKWPFSIPHTFILAHPTDNKKNIENSTTNFSIPHKQESNVFFRPTTAMNRGWGIRKLCKVEDMEAGGFVVDDSICVGIKVYTNP